MSKYLLLEARQRCRENSTRLSSALLLDLPAYGRGGGVGRGRGPGVSAGLDVGEGLGVNVGVAVGMAVDVGDDVGVGVMLTVAVAVGVGEEDSPQYLPPVFRTPLSSYPPQTIIWLPVQTAV